MKQRDSQKQRVYDFEHKIFSLARQKRITNLSLDNAKALVTDACRCYDVNVPTVIYPERYQSKHAHYQPGKCEIVMPEWSRYRDYVLHELAHHIHWKKGNTGESHGPMFFSIFAYLVSEYNGYPLYALFHRANKLGIKYEQNFPKFTNGVPDPKLVVPFS